MLRDLAMADAEQGRAGSPATDLCVAFLLRTSKYIEAMEVFTVVCDTLYCAEQRVVAISSVFLFAKVINVRNNA